MPMETPRCTWPCPASGPSTMARCWVRSSPAGGARWWSTWSGGMSTVRQTDRQGRLPLHVAALHSRELRSVQLLCSDLAVQERDNAGRLPLHAAVAGDAPSPELVSHLLELWPDSVHVTDHRGLTALHVVVTTERHPGRRGDLITMRLAELLVATSPSTLQDLDDQGRLPVHAALMRKRPSSDLVRLLTEPLPGSLLELDRRGQLPLHVALSSGKLAPPDLVELLVKSEPLALQHPDWSGRLPLHILVSRSGPPIGLVQLFVESYPPSVQVRDHQGRLPLHVELSRGRPSWRVAELLIEAWPPSVTMRDSEGVSPLLRAATDARAPLLVLYSMLRLHPDVCCGSCRFATALGLAD
jgi:ankyrin repeat protein